MRAAPAHAMSGTRASVANSQLSSDIRSMQIAAQPSAATAKSLVRAVALTVRGRPAPPD